jgi:hypothetical protein
LFYGTGSLNSAHQSAHKCIAATIGKGTLEFSFPASPFFVMPPLLLQCLYLLILACAALCAFLFPEIGEQLFYRLPWSAGLQPMVGPPGEFRYRLMMWLAGSAAVPVFAVILVRWGFDVAPANQPRKLKEIGWLFLAVVTIFNAIVWLICFVMIFAGPAWVQFEPFYALMLVGQFTLMNAYVHISFLKFRSLFRK